jgi:effector-binding domain-containing protein
MSYEIVTDVAVARPMAAVRRQVHVGSVSGAWRPALDQVWAFLRRHDGLRTDGHNIFVYHHPMRPGEPMAVEFGVEVTGPFVGEGDVVFTRTPAGQVLTTLHVGPYDRLSEAHAAIEAWRAEHGGALGGVSWEIYGDPGDDPSRLEVRVVYLLAPDVRSSI